MTDTTTVLTLPEAEALAERVLAAVVADRTVASSEAMADYFAGRVAADVAGLRDHCGDQSDAESEASCNPCWWMALRGQACPDARRYSDGLRATAALYGVT